MPKVKPLKIGNDLIHSNQRSLADSIFKVVLNNENLLNPNRRSPIAIMQPQSGKTGTMTALVAKCIDHCQKSKRTFQIIVITGLSNLDLTAQTQERFFCKVDGRVRTGAELDLRARKSNLALYPNSVQNKEGILILNNTQALRRLDLNVPDLDVRFILVDEVHVGNVKDGNIDIMLQKHGVRICEQIHTWGNSKTINHFIGISATPAAHMIKSDNVTLDGDSLFHWIYEAPPSNYNSMEVMLNNGRLQPTEPMFDFSGNPTSFFKQALQTFKDSCRKEGPGFFVIRATGKKHQQLIKHINASNSSGNKLECKQFDAERENIKELNNYLSSTPRNPEIVVIRGSMRAGITLPHNNSIRGWIETESVTSDTHVQAGVGRACGYRDNDNYPIYCDIPHVKSWVSAYNQLNNEDQLIIPNGRQNKPMKFNKTYGVLEVMEGLDAAKNKYVRPRVSSGYRTQISSTQGNVLNDVASLLLEGKRDSGSTVGVWVDGPTSKEAEDKYIKVYLKKSKNGRTEADVRAWGNRNRKSYRQLIKEYPQYEGKAVILDIGNPISVASNSSREDLLKKTSAVRKEK